jgi:hypothetical protein
MSIESRLKGRASLIHIQSPDFTLHKDEYFARIRVDNGSIYGNEGPLEYDLPLSKEQYEKLQSQMSSEIFRKPVGEAEGYREPPQISVECSVNLEVRDGETH